MTIAALFILSLAAWSNASAAEWKLEPNPQWCREGYRCLTIADYVHMTTVKIDLEGQIKLLERKTGHFGLGCAVGPSVGLVVDQDFEVKGVPSAVAVTCGLTIKL